VDLGVFEDSGLRQRICVVSPTKLSLVALKLCDSVGAAEIDAEDIGCVVFNWKGRNTDVVPRVGGSDRWSLSSILPSLFERGALWTASSLLISMLGKPSKAITNP
jgi:hypothetical protein